METKKGRCNAGQFHKRVEQYHDKMSKRYRDEGMDEEARQHSDYLSDAKKVTLNHDGECKQCADVEK